MKIKKNGKYLKILLACMLTYLILFTCACLYITYKTGNEPQTLIMSVFAFCGVEGGLSAWIRTTKEKKKDSTEMKNPEMKNPEMKNPEMKNPEMKNPEMKNP